ncbi:ABC transporter ATP-binding protein [Gilvimarinus polysaccharolyticus]|uniref:ABC transporter ATP-binding protein n=1 Tax=Gilvimarinus polysaccharolyticus TaxID=863921 RepID=UPI0006737FE5|nr:ABC transporter ATP-binding protein [Gilvimarinus polysaccharolyticus]
MQDIISAQGLTKTVTTAAGELTILKDISLAVAPGESLAITGASGSGKSTLLGLLAGLDVPSAGLVTLAGNDLTALDEEGRAALRARHVGFVFQSFQLLPGLTALENVMLPLELRGQKGAEAAAKEYLSRVGLAERVGHSPPQLSGGEQQRVAIARAFACEPEILFADEPTGNLDSATGQTINDLLFGLNADAGTTLILITHEQRLAERCQRHIQMAGGELIKGADIEVASC